MPAEMPAEPRQRAKLLELLKLAPSTQGLTDAEMSEWVDRNVEFRRDGRFRLKNADFQRELDRRMKEDF